LHNWIFFIFAGQCAEMKQPSNDMSFIYIYRTMCRDEATIQEMKQPSNDMSFIYIYRTMCLDEATIQ